METREKIELANLPLAVYREIAAHLRQLEGVEVELIPQSSPQFAYKKAKLLVYGLIMLKMLLHKWNRF